MKRILSIIFTSIALVLSMTAVAPVSQADGPPPVVFLSPHQDDESLTMGAAIREHVLAGRTVYVVLLTDGSSSGVCGQSPFNGDRAACTAERDKEFTGAVTKMGAVPVIPTVVAPGNSTARAGDTDGTLTGTFTANVIRYYAGIYGTDASFKTMSEYDSMQPDHRAAGRGLYAAYLWGYIGTGPNTGDARWYVRREDQKVHPGTCTARHNLDTALAYYYPVEGDPASGIGWRSVAGEFQWANNGDGINGPAAYSKSFTPAQRVANGGSYSACYPNM